MFPNFLYGFQLAAAAQALSLVLYAEGVTL